MGSIKYLVTVYFGAGVHTRSMSCSGFAISVSSLSNTSYWQQLISDTEHKQHIDRYKTEQDKQVSKKPVRQVEQETQPQVQNHND